MNFLFGLYKAEIRDQENTNFDTKKVQLNCLVFRYEKGEGAEHDSELAVADLAVPVLVHDADHLIYLLLRDLGTG